MGAGADSAHLLPGRVDERMEPVRVAGLADRKVSQLGHILPQAPRSRFMTAATANKLFPQESRVVVIHLGHIEDGRRPQRDRLAGTD